MSKKQSPTTDNTVVQTGPQTFVCKCPVHSAKPRNLVLRPDLAGEDNDHSKLALCIFTKPVAVHEWDPQVSDYKLREDLEFQNNQVVYKEGGRVFASATLPSLADLDTDEAETHSRDELPKRPGSSQPAPGDHVDLERDFYY